MEVIGDFCWSILVEGKEEKLESKLERFGDFCVCFWGYIVLLVMFFIGEFFF